MYSPLSPLIVPAWQEAHVSAWRLAGETHFDWSALQSERGPAAADLVSSRPALVQEFPPVLIFCLRREKMGKNENEGKRQSRQHLRWQLEEFLRSEAKGVFGCNRLNQQ